MNVPPDFCPVLYKSFYKDLQALSDHAATVHYVKNGMYEGRIYKLENPNDFDVAFYKNTYKDLQSMTDLEAEVHYTQCGRYEGRRYNSTHVPIPPLARPILLPRTRMVAPQKPCSMRKPNPRPYKPPMPPMPPMPPIHKPYVEKPCSSKTMEPPVHPISPTLSEQPYIVITTLKGYEKALNYILESVPIEWKPRVIIVYQKEPIRMYTICEDGHIEVRLQRNIYEYGAWIGVHMLIEKNVIHRDQWCLFVHDTCKFGPNSRRLVEEIVHHHDHTDIDCIWLCKHGLRNLCLLRRLAIYKGFKRYEDIQTMTKHEAIEGEMNHFSRLSPKSFPVRQLFLPYELYVKDKRYVYGTNLRDVEQFDSIDLEKYVFPLFNVNMSHPHNP